MIWLIFVTVAVWVFLLLNWFTRRQRHMNNRIEDFAVRKPVRQKQGDNRAKLTPVAWFRWLLKNSGGRLRLKSGQRMSKVQERLNQAGNPGNLSVSEWIGLRLVLVLAAAALGLIMLGMTQRPLLGLTMLLTIALLGWIGPEFWLSRRIKLRSGELLKQFPSVLDLLTVSVEAGLGFDQAMAKVAEKMHGALPIEFERALKEIQLGSPRTPALQRMAKRTGVDEVTSFVSAVVQADKLGIGMAQVLRVQSVEVRRKRRMDASERAQKAPVKMLFPLIFFVFPALFIVILGPAALHLLGLFQQVH